MEIFPGERLDNTSCNTIFKNKGVPRAVFEELDAWHSIEDFLFHGEPMKLEPMTHAVPEPTESNRKTCDMQVYTMLGSTDLYAATVTRKWGGPSGLSKSSADCWRRTRCVG